MNNTTLRLKMSVERVTRTANSQGNIDSEEIILRAVYGPEGSPNEQWSKWTPSGQLIMSISNPSAHGKVLPGQFYFVDLIPTTKEGI